jgi:hypothetical protein
MSIAVIEIRQRKIEINTKISGIGITILIPISGQKSHTNLVRIKGCVIKEVKSIILYFV